jgi:hypothetical protein
VYICTGPYQQLAACFMPVEAGEMQQRTAWNLHIHLH